MDPQSPKKITCSLGPPRTDGLARLPHDLMQMRDVHPWFKNQTERLLMRHDPRYKRRVVDRPLGVFCDRKCPKEGRRGDIERPAKVMSSVASLLIPIVRRESRRHGDGQDS